MKFNAREGSVSLRNGNLRLIFGVTLMGVMAVSLIAPVFPQVVSAFDISADQVTLLITLYTVPGMLLSPVYGILADRLGRMRVLVPSLALFGLAGGACGLAPDYPTLLALRFLQGLGGGGLFTLNNTLIGDLFEGRSRVAAMGMNASVISIGTAVYPAIGGVLGGLSWRLPFFLPTVALAVAAAALVTLKLPRRQTNQPLRGYLSDTANYVRRWTMLRLFLLSFIIFAVIFGSVISFLPIWMKLRFNASPTVIGFYFSLASGVAAVTAARLRPLSERLGINWLTTVGLVGYAVGLAGLVIAPSLGWFVAPVIMLGLAQGLVLPAVQTLIVNSAPVAFRGAFMSINSLVILAAISIGPAVGAVIYRGVGIEPLFYIGAGVCIFSAVLIRLMRNAGIN